MTKNFYGFRLEQELAHIVDTVANEMHGDKTRAIKLLLREGWQNYRLKKALALYAEGKISIDKGAEIAEITVGEMMQEAARHNLGSTETVHDYKESLKKLIA